MRDVVRSEPKPTFMPSPQVTPAPVTDQAGPSQPIDRYAPVRAASPQAALQYLRAEFERALKRRSDITSGAKGVNVFELNEYVAHTDPNNDKLITGHESALRDAIETQVRRTGRKLQPGDVFALSLELNEGNVAKALITVHNAFRALSRGDDQPTGILAQDLDFFHDYLDTRFRTEPTSRKTDLSDDWYHLFGLASVGFVSREKGFFDLRRDAASAEGVSPWASAPIWAGGASKLVGNLIPMKDMLTSWMADRYGLPKADSTALIDALGEQLLFGLLMNGLENGWAQAVGGTFDRIKPGGKGIGDDWSEVSAQLSEGWKRGAGALEFDEFKAELYGADLGRYLSERVK